MTTLKEVSVYVCTYVGYMTQKYLKGPEPATQILMSNVYKRSFGCSSPTQWLHAPPLSHQITPIKM